MSTWYWRRSSSGIARAISGTSTSASSAARERGIDRRRVDRALAARRRTLDEQRRVAPLSDQLADALGHCRLLRAELRVVGQRAARRFGPALARPPLDPHHLDVDVATSGKAADRARAVSRGEIGGCDRLGRLTQLVRAESRCRGPRRTSADASASSPAVGDAHLALDLLARRGRADVPLRRNAAVVRRSRRHARRARAFPVRASRERPAPAERGSAW